MKNKNIMGIILIIATLSISGCTNGNVKTFENDEIIFGYPESWVNSSNFWPSNFGFNYVLSHDPHLNAQEVAFIIDPNSSTINNKYTTWVKVEKKVKNGDSLEKTFNDTYYNNFTAKKIISNQSQLAGMDNAAYEIVYQKYRGENLYQVRDVWKDKNETIYIISCWSLPSNYQKSQGYFQKVINTLYIK